MREFLWTIFTGIFLVSISLHSNAQLTSTPSRHTSVADWKDDIDTVPQRIEKVDVISKSAVRSLKDSPLSVETIELKKSHARSGDVSEYLNRTTGVKVRYDGNIGAQAQINLGGLQGKAVRLFRDGIPIELFGHAFNLGTLPVNMLDRIEIYKGAMPIHIASDALGGGVNLVSRQEYQNTAEVSYELASFGTHRVTAHARWQDKAQKWYFGTNSSFNYSDNNYPVLVPYHDDESNSTTYRDSRRFHDAARIHYLEGFVGWKNRAWTDDFRLTLIQSSFYREIQHDAKMYQVYGEAYGKERSATGMAHYKKALMQGRLTVDGLAVYSMFDTRMVDTSTRRYDWNGRVLPGRHRPGEINMGSLQQLDYRLVSGRLAVSYKVGPNHSIDLTQIYQRQHRKGSDPLGAISAIEKIDVLTEPAVYAKNTQALGLRSKWWGDRLESVVAIKHYGYDIEGYTTDNTGLGWRSRSDGNRWGYLGGLRWSQGRVTTKLSYEQATRLPDEFEIFGDGLTVRENMDLKPEKGHNLNVNGQYTTEKLDLALGLFYRRVRDIVFLQLDIPFNRHINYEQARIKGVEFEGNYRPFHWADLSLNLTYQDIRRVNIQEPMYRNLEGSRVPNVPFLFGNGGASTHFSEVWKKGDRLDIFWNSHYTHRFFLLAVSKRQEPGLFERVKDFQTSLVIPADDRLGQWAHDAGISYTFGRPRVSLSFTCRNIANTRLYDNFGVQKPGRSAHLKVVYNFL